MADVLGFLVQCEVCPQQAIIAEQQDGWVCPRCTMSGFDSRIGAAMAAAMAAADKRITAKLDRSQFVKMSPQVVADNEPEGQSLTAFIRRQLRWQIRNLRDR